MVEDFPVSSFVVVLGGSAHRLSVHKRLDVLTILLPWITHAAFACIPTSSSGTPSITDCCAALLQTPSADFPDGTMTFAYNSDTCRTSVVATCSDSSSTGLNAAIIANQVSFLDIAASSVTFPGTCTNGQWFMGDPPLLIEDLECALTMNTG